MERGGEGGTGAAHLRARNVGVVTGGAPGRHLGPGCFAKDCYDREVMAWRAWVGKGLPGEPVRDSDMLIEAVEKRFGALDAIPARHALEFLSDNGGAYIAHDMRQIARALGLKPIRTLVCSSQNNRNAECFVIRR